MIFEIERVENLLVLEGICEIAVVWCNKLETDEARGLK
jgi:hypothetical protein